MHPSSRALHKSIASLPFYICSSCLVRRHPSSAIHSLVQNVSSRAFTASASAYSGHNRWSKIKHDKAKNDSVIMKQRGVYTAEITNASRLHGPDPKLNPHLELAIMRAKKTGFPKASIEAAIARGQGLTSSGAKLESMIEEVMFPPSVAIIVDCMTDNKLRTKTEIRKALKDCGGGTLSSASYLFEKKGRISLRGREGLDLDTVLEPALEAGALDVEDGKDGGFIVYTQVSDLKSVSDALVQGLGVEVEDLRIIWDPQTRVDLDSGLIATQVDKFSCALNENPSVQDLYTNTTRRDHEAV